MTEQLSRPFTPSLAANAVDPLPPAAPDGARSGFRFDVAVVGLGYVGLPTALAFHAAGCRVLGLDVSAARIAAIAADEVDLVPDDRARLARARFDSRFRSSTDTALLSQAAAVIVCVPTPVDDHRVPDLDALRRACRTVVAHAVPGQVLILTSTTYVGSTYAMLTAPLAARGLEVGTHVHVAFSPERIDPGNDVAHEAVPRVIGGATRACTAAAEKVLGRYAEHLHAVGTPEAAEMSKLLENTFRAVNIALVNEFAEICRSMGIDVIDVIAAAATKPYGYMPFYPGPGVGGHCIPCDPHYLLWQLRKHHVASPVIENAMNSIAGRPHHVVQRAWQTLSDAGTAIAGARVLVVGIAYKPDVADLRESPALAILDGLARAGAEVGYLDPLFGSVRLACGIELDGVRDPGDFRPDLVIVHTVHAGTDLSWLTGDAPVLDTSYRNLHLPRAVAL